MKSRIHKRILICGKGESGKGIIILLLLFPIIFAGCFAMSQINNGSENKRDTIRITIIYDNNPLVEGLQPDWGFSCLVEVGETRLLFDTGDDGNILLSNMSKLKINPKDIDLVFLSHFHHDHTGGLSDFLKINPEVTVYYPQSFPDQLTELINKSGAKSVSIFSFQELQQNIFSFGEISGAIPEQSLAVRTNKGIVVITGCAHPGIIEILQKAMEQFPDEKIYLALGGFHLYNQAQSEINEKVNEMIKMGIINVGPCHCSGDNARNSFNEVYSDNYIEIGVGSVIQIK